MWAEAQESFFGVHNTFWSWYEVQHLGLLWDLWFINWGWSEVHGLELVTGTWIGAALRLEKHCGRYAE